MYGVLRVGMPYLKLYHKTNSQPTYLYYPLCVAYNIVTFLWTANFPSSFDFTSAI